jgi:cytochrome c553
MKALVALSLLFVIGPAAAAADVEAGKPGPPPSAPPATARNGVSVADAIPNLAGQKPAYLEAQLRALKDGSRKNPVMNAIASQLSPDDIANVAAYFATQTGATSTAKVGFPAEPREDERQVPRGYQTTFKKYHTINFPATKQVRYYFANDTALRAAKDGKTLPDGSVLFAEVYSTKNGPDGKPSPGPMASSSPISSCSTRDGARSGMGQGHSRHAAQRGLELRGLRDDEAAAPVNQAECLACHKPLDKVSYTFTLDQLTAAAKR